MHYTDRFIICLTTFAVFQIALYIAYKPYFKNKIRIVILIFGILNGLIGILSLKDPILILTYFMLLFAIGYILCAH